MNGMGLAKRDESSNTAICGFTAEGSELLGRIECHTTEGNCCRAFPIPLNLTTIWRVNHLRRRAALKVKSESKEEMQCLASANSLGTSTFSPMSQIVIRQRRRDHKTALKVGMKAIRTSKDKHRLQHILHSNTSY